MNASVEKVFKMLRYAHKNNLHCISIYRTFSNWSESTIRNEIGKQIKVAIQNCKDIKIDSNQINFTTEQIISIISKIPFYKNSVGIFIVDDLNKEGPKTFKLNQNIIVIFSDVIIEDYQNCNKIFSLKGLFKMTEYFSDSLCINISKKETKYYLLNSEFRLIKTVENIILEAYEDRFRNKTPGATGGGFVHGGSGSDEKEAKFAKKILNDAITNLKKFAKLQNQYKYIIVFYSDDFAGYSEFINESIKFYSQTPPCLEKKIIDNENELEKEFKKALESCNKKITEEKLSKYKTGIDGTFKCDITNIISAAAEARIQKIYIKENAVLKGYVLNKDIPYIKKVEGSEETEELVDWTIKKIVETGGEVFILTKDTNLIECEIAAKLRY